MVWCGVVSGVAWWMVVRGEVVVSGVAWWMVVHGEVVVSGDIVVSGVCMITIVMSGEWCVRGEYW